jgi:L-type amino acid transporter 5
MCYNLKYNATYFVPGLLTALNCTNVKWVTRVQDFFVGAKIVALAIVVIAGIVFLGEGNTQNLSQPLQGSATDPGFIALAFYSGLFSYAGWYVASFFAFVIRGVAKGEVLGV